jgi:dihydrofolate synthase/folylpolyglutamate synthase
MPQSVFAALAASGARAVVAERDFHWQLTGAGWDFVGLGLTLQALPPSALAGAIQYRNAATAIAAAQVMRTAAPVRPAVERLVTRLGALDAGSVAQALGRVRLAGRFQIVPGEVEWILDIAHNEPAALTLAAQLRARPLPVAASGRAGRTFAVIGVLADKDAGAIAAALADVIDCWIACALPGPRGTSATQLAARLGAPAQNAQLAESVEAGCELAQSAARPGDRIIVCGSVYIVGPALRWLRIY